MVIKTPVGGLPVGAIVTTSETIPVLEKGFAAWKSLLPDKPFNGKDTPAILMTDDCEHLKTALSSVFPNAVQLLCIFHLLQVIVVVNALIE